MRGISDSNLRQILKGKEETGWPYTVYFEEDEYFNFLEINDWLLEHFGNLPRLI